MQEGYTFDNLLRVHLSSICNFASPWFGSRRGIDPTTQIRWCANNKQTNFKKYNKFTYLMILANCFIHFTAETCTSTVESKTASEAPPTGT